ncbi:MAG: PAS domain-containing sensor histidine kinase, partial [Thermodesulfobacteriota bacterium]
MKKKKEVKNKLRETLEVLELAISGSNAGLWNLKFNLEDPYKIPDEIYISPRLKGFIGFGEDEFPNSISAWHSRIHPEDLELVRKVTREHLEGKREIYEVEYRIYHKDGGIRWIFSQGKILRDENGVPQQWTGIDWDITEQKKKEEELRAREEKYRALVERSIQAIAIIQDFRIVFANERCAELVGYTVEELLSLPSEKVIALIHPDDQELVLGRFKDRLEGKDVPPHYEYRFIRKDGSVRWVEIFSSLIQYGGKSAVQAAFVDITKRKQAEEALKFERDQLLSLFDSINQIIYVTDPKSYEVLFVNKYLRELLGKDPVGGLCYKEFQELDHPCEFCTNDIILNLKGKPYRWEYHNPILNRDYEITDRIIKWPDGREVRFEIAIDITDRKEAENKLCESEERYRLVVENAGDVIAIVQDGYFRFLNRRASELLGYSLEELLSLSFWEIIHPEDREKVLESYSKILRREAIPSIYSFRVIDKEGNIKWVEINLVMIPYERKDSILSFIRDITDRKRIEEELWESERRLKDLFDYAPVGYHEINMEGRIVNVNKKELEMLGYNYGEMVGQFVWNFNLEEGTSRQNVLEKLAGIKPPGESFERIYKKKDGSTLPVLIQDRVLRDQEGKIIGIRSTIQDIMELKKKEQEISSLQEHLRQAQKMEAIGRLAGGIAHDFNNILSVIKGNCQLSLLDLREGDPLYTNLKEIEMASNRAADLTRQLLAFSRKQIMEIRIVDLNEVVRGLEKMLRRIIGEDIELITFLSEDLWRVRVDPGQMEQAIINIVVNARDAMPEGGKLTIETANVELDEEYARRHIAVTPGQYVMLSVSDTGCGMTPEVKERIFEPFFTTKGKEKGTGLGLSTVYGIVKQSGGNIWVYSEPSKGTTFKIYLPRVEEGLEEVAVRKKVIEEIPYGNETVLVVEDEEVVRKLAVR